LQAGEAPARLEENVVDNVGPVPADQVHLADDPFMLVMVPLVFSSTA
jgi:hypothetical protein